MASHSTACSMWFTCLSSRFAYFYEFLYSVSIFMISYIWLSSDTPCSATVWITLHSTIYVCDRQNMPVMDPGSWGYSTLISKRNDILRQARDESQDKALLEQAWGPGSNTQYQNRNKHINRAAAGIKTASQLTLRSEDFKPRTAEPWS